MDRNRITELSDEWIRFIILAIVMTSVVLIVALARPLIFEHIVPAVMGEGTPPLQIDKPAAPQLEEPVDAGDTTPRQLDESPADVEGASEADAAQTGEAEVSAELVHIVVTGDTLALIAELYEVSVDAIVQANGLSNPDQIRIGDRLIIPANDQ